MNNFHHIGVDPDPGPWQRAAPWVVVLCGAGLFASTWSDAVQVADSAELVAVACSRGVAHPPGYPLFTLAGNLFCSLPWSTPAGRVGWFSLLCGLWTLLMVHALVARLTGNRWAAVVAALTLAAGSVFWRLSSQAEVFSLNTALCLSLVYAAWRAGEVGGDHRRPWCLVCGLLCGLGLSNHHTSVLVMPLAAVAILRPWRPLGVLLARAAAAALGAVLGLTPYLYLLYTDPLNLPRWGDTHTLAGLLDHFLRRDYGSLTLALGHETGRLDNLWGYLCHLPAQFAWVLWPFAVAGLVCLCAGRKGIPDREGARASRRDMALALGAVTLLAGPGLMLLFNIPPRGIGLQVVSRFYALPNALLSVCLGVGLAAADRRWLATAIPKRALLWRITALAVVLLAAALSYGDADVSENYVVEDYAENVLNTVEQGALVLGDGDVRLFAMYHAQQVRKIRPDVLYVDVRMLLYPWYVAQLRQRRPGFSYSFSAGHVDSLGLIQRELQRGVPVYLARIYNKKVSAAFTGYPLGPLIRLLLRGTAPPAPQDLYVTNLRLQQRYLRRGRLPLPEADPWSAFLLEPFRDNWISLARALKLSNQPGLARQALSQARQWSPGGVLPAPPGGGR